MKRDKFYLVIGILQIILAVFLIIKSEIVFASILFVLGIISITKDYLNLWKFKWQR